GAPRARRGAPSPPSAAGRAGAAPLPAPREPRLAPRAPVSRSRPAAGPLGPRLLLGGIPASRRALTFPALGLRPGRSGPACCSAGYPPRDARSRFPLSACGRAARAPLAARRDTRLATRAHVSRSRPAAGPLGPRLL